MNVKQPKDADGRERELVSLSWADGVPAPVDAGGEVVPLNTYELYTDDGETVKVGSIIYNRYSWYVRSPGSGRLYRLDTLHRTKQDSLKQLAEDLNRVQAKHDANGATYRDSACSYVGRLGVTCKGCGLNRGDKTCFEAMMADIVSRVNRLAGDSE